MEHINISSVHLEGHFHWMIVWLTSNWRKRVIIYQVINRNGESLLLLLFFFFIFFNFNLIIDAQEFNWLVTGYTVYKQWITNAVKVKTTKKTYHRTICRITQRSVFEGGLSLYVTHKIYSKICKKIQLNSTVF